MALLTLTTDFGTADHFTGAMKGVIASLAPGVPIIDITHELPAYEVLEAAFVIAEASRWYPKGTVHVVVVDPGVGSSRRAILVESGGQLYVGPDNGVFTFVLAADPKAKVRAITNEEFFLHPVSHTFHGRDLFAPVGARLAAGLRPAQCGKRVEDALRLQWGAPRQISKRQWTGAVLRIDRFGNLITSFRLSEFPWILERPMEIAVGMERLDRTATHYAECEYGELYAVGGSSGYLEIVQREASAARRLGVAAGAPVDISGW